MLTPHPLLNYTSLDNVLAGTKTFYYCCGLLHNVCVLLSEATLIFYSLSETGIQAILRAY